MGKDFDADSGQSGIAHAITAGMLIGDPQIVVANALATVVVPAGARLEQIDLRALELKYAAHPLRKTGRYPMATPGSFIEYVSKHKTSATAIYGSKSEVKFTAVFNDHDFAEAGHRDYTAVYACPLSVEWVRWNNHSQHGAENKKGVSQAEFMQFLEDNLLDVTNPPSGLLLQAIQSFEAHKDVQFKTATRLDNGQVIFKYTEAINEVQQEGKLSLPQMFTITIPVFDGGAKFEIDARLRYRISGGGLILWYELVNPHKSLEYAFGKVAEEIHAGTTDVPMYSV